MLGISPTTLVEVKNTKRAEAAANDCLTHGVYNLKWNAHTPKLALQIEYLGLPGNVAEQPPDRCVRCSLNN
jgi:hypothetical protein